MRLNLEQIQREMFKAVRTPLTVEENMRENALDGSSLHELAKQIIKPNDRLTSFERLELYNRQYWWRLLSALAEDFEGLKAIIGDERFEKMSIAYLVEHPSHSFTLRNLGRHLAEWLRAHPEHIAGVEELAIDMARLEWAEIEAFDEAELPRLSDADLAKLGEDPYFKSQPHLRLLELRYPVDDLSIKIKHEEADEETDRASNAFSSREHIGDVRVKLPRRQKVYVAVYRSEHSVWFKRLTRDAFALLHALQEGKRLSEAIEASVDLTGAAPEKIMKKLHDHFANWARLGWFCKEAQE